MSDRPAPADDLVSLPIDLTTEPGLWPEWMRRTSGITGLAPVESLDDFRLAATDPPVRPAPRRRKPVPQCERCSAELPVRARKGTRYCSTRCRVAAHRSRPPVDRRPAQRGPADPDPIPTELRTRPRWLTHSTGKVPLDAHGRIASSTEPATWSPYEAVKDKPRRGFALDGDGVVCIDLDHCVVDGRVVGRAAQILADLPPTYVELSPSGTGLHVWGFGRVERGRKLFGGVELYGTGRFITVTGVPWRTSVRSLADLSGVIERLV